MKTLHLRLYYRKHATLIECLACIAITILFITAIILCVIHGATIDNFLPNNF
jgi:hypothetical protein